MNHIRLEEEDLSVLSPETVSLLNRNIYRTESEWLRCPDPVRESDRLIIISLRSDNIENYENWQRNMEIRKVRDFIASGICTITIVHCMLWSINWIFMMLRMKDSPEAEDTDTNTSADLFHCLRSGICTGSDL